MKNQIETLLLNILPQGSFIQVENYSMMGHNFTKIAFAASDYRINNVNGQLPHVVSLCLSENLDLKVQSYGCCGGQRIYRDINKEDPKEKFYAMIGIKIPFRKPQANETAVLKAIEKFAVNWKNTITENIDVIRYKEHFPYQNFI